MSTQVRRLLGVIASITASLFLVSCGTAIAGVYVAIWGDNAFGGRIIATGLITAILMACVGIPAHRYIKDAQ